MDVGHSLSKQNSVLTKIKSGLSLGEERTAKQYFIALYVCYKKFYFNFMIVNADSYVGLTKQR